LTYITSSPGGKNTLSIFADYWKKRGGNLTEIENIETIFFNVLEDLKDYLADLTLVGGWMPYVYSKYLWDNLIVNQLLLLILTLG